MSCFDVKLIHSLIEISLVSLSLSLSLLPACSLTVCLSFHTPHYFCLVSLYTWFSLLQCLPFHLPYIHLYFFRVLYTEPYPCAYNIASNIERKPLPPVFWHSRGRGKSLYTYTLKSNPNIGYIKPFWERKRLKHAKKNPTQNKFIRGHICYFWFCFCFFSFYLFWTFCNLKSTICAEQRQCARKLLLSFVCYLYFSFLLVVILSIIYMKKNRFAKTIRMSDFIYFMTILKRATTTKSAIITSTINDRKTFLSLFVYCLRHTVGHPFIEDMNTSHSQ